jgi:hypothetical protein
VFSESFTVTLQDGYASLVLGADDSLNDTALAGPRWVETRVDGVAVGPRQRLTAAPSAATVAGLTAEQLVARTEITLQGTELTGLGSQLDGWQMDGSALVLGGGGWGAGLTDLIVPTGETVLLSPGVHAYNTVRIEGTVVPQAFNGVDGGVIDIQARGEVLISGTVDASARGYRGGRAEYSFLTNQAQGTPGQPGESIVGWYREGGEISGSNVVGGGGGGLYDAGNYGCAGGGGGYAGAGVTRDCPRNASLDATGGQPYGDAQLSVLYLGSGGGASGSDEDHLGRGGHGGNGGGAIRIQADSLVLTGQILSDGARGGNATISNNGGGGGGSGGSIHLRARQLNLSGTVSAAGGAGGSEVGGGGTGGPGGVGRIRLDGAQVAVGGSISPAPGLLDEDGAYADGGRHYGVYTSPTLSFDGDGRWAAVHAFVSTGPSSGHTVQLCSGPDALSVANEACFQAVAQTGAVLAGDGDRFGRVRVIAWDASETVQLQAIRLEVAR